MVNTRTLHRLRDPGMSLIQQVSVDKITHNYQLYNLNSPTPLHTRRSSVAEASYMYTLDLPIKFADYANTVRR